MCKVIVIVLLFLIYILLAIHKTARAFLKNPALNVFGVSKFFISFGKMFHIFGAKTKTDSVPYLTEFTLRVIALS